MSSPDSPWIPCSERLPPIDTWVLATVVLRYGGSIRLHDVFRLKRIVHECDIRMPDDGTWYMSSGDKWWKPEDVIGWMPLPDPMPTP